jgi:hypothetical protein
MPKRLLFVCSKTFPGSYKVLTNLQGVLDGRAEVKILPIEDLLTFKSPIGNARVRNRINKTQIDLKMINISPLADYGDNIFFAGWGPLYDVVLEKLNHKGIAPSLIMCSTIGQSELASHELISYHNIIQYLKRKNLKYWLLNRRLFDSVGQMIKGSILFPHTIDLNQFKDVVRKDIPGRNIDLFCQPRPGKNILNQLMGYKLSGISANIHINFRNERFEKIISDFDITVQRHGWMADNEYYGFLKSMDMSLQVTFTESFNYAVAERMCLSVPTMTSYDIYFTADDPLLAKHLCIQGLDTPAEIGRSIKNIMDDDKLRKNLGDQSRTVIETIARKNNQAATDFIMDVLK